MNSIVLIKSIFNEGSIRTISNILDRNIQKFDLAVLPIPEELISYSFRGYIGSKTVDQVAKRVVQDYEGLIIQIKPLIRIVKPLIEVIYKALTVNPEIEILTTYSMEKLREGEITTIDIISLTINIKRLLRKVHELHIRVRDNVLKTLRNIYNIVLKLSSRKFRKCIIIPSSCMECILFREFINNMNLNYDTISICAEIVPPSQLIYIALYLKDNEIIREVYEYYKDFIMNYILISKTIYDAYCSYLRDKIGNYKYVSSNVVKEFVKSIRDILSNYDIISTSR